MLPIEIFDTTKEIRLLTLRQPFASLLFAGKTTETRTWHTKYRGQILISASKKSYTWDQVQNICTVDQFERILEWCKNDGLGHEKLCGHAIGMVNLIECSEMEIDDQEAAFVEYSHDLFSWEFRDQRNIIPFQIKGSITFSPLPLEIKQQITVCQTTMQL